MLKTSISILSVVLLGLVSQTAIAADDPADALAKEVVQQFVKAIKAKDAKETKLTEVMKLVAVPWFDIHDDRTIKDEAELKKSLAAMLGRLDPARVLSESIEVAAYAKYREKASDEAAGKALDKVLDKGKDDRIVIISSEDGPGGRFILVQVRERKAKVVGGPYGVAYLNHIRIPKNARLALEKAERLELYSLDPAREEKKPADDFHGWKVLGKTIVKDTDKDAAKQKLVDAFKQGVADSDSAAAGCFNPRHGIRVIHDGRTVDFVICFECLSVAVYVGDEKEGGFLIADSPQDAFNQVLRDAKVPLPKKAED